MVYRTENAVEFTPHEFGVLEQNMTWIGDIVLRAHVMGAVKRAMQVQTRQRIRLKMAGHDAEPNPMVPLSPEVTDQIVDSLRAGAADETKPYIVDRPALQHIIDAVDESRDEMRREQIITADPIHDWPIL